MNDLEFMLHPEMWPWWPLLTLVKHGKCGTLIEIQNGYAFREGVSIFTGPTEKAEPEIIGKEELLEKLVKDGWEVD